MSKQQRQGSGSTSNKQLYIGFAIVGVLVVALGSATQIDDELSSEATRLISLVDFEGESDSYLFLMGLHANEGQDPIELGRNLLAEQRKKEVDSSYVERKPDESLYMPRPDGPLFCRIRDEGCLARLFSEQIDIERLSQEHAALMQRMEKFHSFTEFKTLTKPSLDEIYPRYQYVSAAERIRLLKSISMFNSGNHREAIDALHAQLEDARHSLELQDNLIGKLVFLVNVSAILDVMSIIHSRSNSAAELLPQLTPGEKNMDVVLAREFVMAYYVYQNLDRHPDAFEMGGSAPGWFVRVLFKPNMTINALVPVYTRALALAKQNATEFALDIETWEIPAPATSRLRNLLGSFLLMPQNYDEYIAALFDLDAKLLTFNHLYRSRGDLAELKNPFYPEETPVVLADRVCLRGPLEDKRGLRCLRIAAEQDQSL